MSDRNDLLSTQDQLGTAEGATAILDALHDTIGTLKMPPHEAVNSQICGDVLFGSVNQDIACLRAADRDIVDIWNSGVGYFWLEDVSDVVMEDRDRIGPSHQQRDESERAEG